MVATLAVGDPALGEGDGVLVGVGVGVGLTLGLGAGVGERCFDLVFALGDGLGVTDGEGELFLCFTRCRLGVGVGLTKTCLIFSPNDGAAAPAWGATSSI